MPVSIKSLYVHCVFQRVDNMLRSVPTCLLVLCTVPVKSEILVNNAVIAGLTAEGLRTRARPGGGDYSEIQYGNIVYGWSFRNSSARLADDFTVAGQSWFVREFVTWGFQIGIDGPTVNTGFMEICAGSCDGPVVAQGVFNRAEMTDIYRIYFQDPSREYRLQKVTYRLNAVLSPGYYWAR